MVIGGTVVPSSHFESSKKYITVPFELDDSDHRFFPIVRKWKESLADIERLPTELGPAACPVVSLGPSSPFSTVAPS